MVGDAKADDGVPLVLGVNLRQRCLPEQTLGLVQGGPQPHSQAEQLVAGGLPPSGKRLMQVYLAHPSLAGQGGLGDILLS